MSTSSGDHKTNHPVTCHDGIMTTIGFLHPGNMGVTIAAAARADGLWAGHGRSAESAARAASAALSDCGDIETLCDRAEIVLSICPPDAALGVADAVAATGFDGIYIDANAIAPETSLSIRSRFDRYIDGGVIGPPAVAAGTTRMYLAGPGAIEVARLWQDSTLEVRALSESSEQASASALKMAYAGWTKGQSALLLSVAALARSAGVEQALRAEWDLSQPGLVERSERVAGGVGPKAWRFAGEMAEIAASMASAGLPSGFHTGAENLYRRLAGFKDEPGPALEEVLSTILANPLSGSDRSPEGDDRN